MTLQQVPVGHAPWTSSDDLGPESACVRACSLCVCVTCVYVCAQEHLNVCGFFEVPCPLAQCPERMMRKEIPEHLSWRCLHREATCDFCKTKMPMTELQVSRDVTSCPPSGPKVGLSAVFLAAVPQVATRWKCCVAMLPEGCSVAMTNQWVDDILLASQRAG